MDFSLNKVNFEAIEKINKQKLAYILLNKDKFPDINWHTYCKWTGKMVDHFTELGKLYCNSDEKGFNFTEYHNKGGFGLLYSRSSSIQFCKNTIKHTILDGRYFDIDIKNSFYTMLIYLCKSEGIECSKAIDYYNNRSKLIEGIDELKIKDHKGDIVRGKRIGLSILHDGQEYLNLLNEHSPEKAKFFNELRDEIIKIRELLVKSDNKYRQIYKRREKLCKKGDRRIWGSFISAILGRIQCNVMIDMTNYLIEQGYIGQVKGRPDYISCFDGICIKADSYNTEHLAEILEECSDHINGKYDGMSLTLVEKPMDNPLDISLAETDSTTISKKFVVIDDSAIFEQFADKVKYDKISSIVDRMIENDDINHKEMANICSIDIGDNMKITNSEGDGYFWNESKKIWKSSYSKQMYIKLCRDGNIVEEVINNYLKKYEDSVICLKKDIRDAKKSNKKADDEDKIDIDILTDDMDYSKSNSKKCKKMLEMLKNVHGVKNIYTFMTTDNKIDQKFELEVINRQHNLLPIANNKIIDLQTCEIRNRCKTDLFSLECNVNYIPEDQWNSSDREELDMFIGKICCDRKDYLEFQQMKLGSYLCGLSSRDMDIWHGVGKNGKSVLMNSLKAILGDFVGSISKDVLVRDRTHKKIKNPNNHTAGLNKILGKRVMVSTELEEGDCLEDGICKVLTGGDAIELRFCYGKETFSYTSMASYIISTQYIPDFNVNDTAITDRLNFLPFQARFVNDVSETKDKEDLKHYKVNKQLVNKFTSKGRMLDIFFSWLVHGCMKYYQYVDKNEIIPRPDLVKCNAKKVTHEADIVAQWIDDVCDIDEAKYTIASDLFEDFNSWAYKNGNSKGWTKRKFNADLVKKGYNKVKKSGSIVIEGVVFRNNDNVCVDELIKNLS
jgi:P4 family phage/plasmid primase-like protien